MIADVTFMVAGWLLAAEAGSLAIRFNGDRRIMSLRRPESARFDWRTGTAIELVAGAADDGIGGRSGQVAGGNDVALAAERDQPRRTVGGFESNRPA